MDYQRLLAEHDQIDALCLALASAVSAEGPDVDAILRIRSDLAATLTWHLAHEDSFIYPGMATRCGASASVAAAFVTEFAKLTADWSLYLEEWTVECIVEDWATFRDETQALIARLRVRVRREDEALYPSALRTGAITLRPLARIVPTPEI